MGVVASVGADLPGGFTVNIADSVIFIEIEEESIDKVFLPHIRLKNAMSRNALGSGLGLPIVERLVLCHGNVQVENQLNKGTEI